MEEIQPISADLLRGGVNNVGDVTGWSAFMSGLGVTCIIVYVVRAWLLSRIFKKAKVSRWKAWVPIVNEWNYLKIGGRSGGNVFFGIGGSLLLSIGMVSQGYFSIDKTLVMAPVLCIITLVLAITCLVIYAYKIIASTWNIQKKLGKSGWFIILFFINLIAPLWLWILALDGSKWNDKKGIPSIK